MSVFFGENMKIKIFINGKSYILSISNYSITLVEEEKLRSIIWQKIYEVVNELKNSIYEICRPNDDEVLKGEPDWKSYTSKECAMYSLYVINRVREKLSYEGWL